MSKGIQAYDKYSQEVVTASLFNAIEVYWVLLRDFGDVVAKVHYSRIRDCSIAVPDDIIFDAMKFRLRHKKKKFSYADSIGYVLAKKNNLVFLTSDKEFRGMENVEFVE